MEITTTIFMMILIVGGLLAVVMLVIGVVVTARSERTLVEERLGRFLEDEAELAAQKKAMRETPVGDWLNRRMEKSKLGGGIARELARADLKLKPAEYLATMVISGVGTAFVFWILNKRGAVLHWFVILGFIVGLFIPRYYVKRLQTKRLIRFSDQIADMLNLLVNGLRAGYSTMQAMEAVSKEMPSPICDEFRRVVQEMQLGVPMDEALENLLRRIPSGDLDLMITAVNVQREVGGNLAEILDTISYTIRERVRIKGEIRVLTSQVLYSGRFLAMMPLIIAAILYVLNREYMMAFFDKSLSPPGCIITPGIIALVIAALLISSGYFIMTRIANIEV